MHEPIIDIETWNKTQDKLNGYTKVQDRKYDHLLKGLVYCEECGNKATLRCWEEKMVAFGEHTPNFLMSGNNIEVKCQSNSLFKATIYSDTLRYYKWYIKWYFKILIK